MGEIIILGIAGSLRKDSYNRLALKAAQELVPDGSDYGLIRFCFAKNEATLAAAGEAACDLKSRRRQDGASAIMPMRAARARTCRAHAART